MDGCGEVTFQSKSWKTPRHKSSKPLPVEVLSKAHLIGLITLTESKIQLSPVTPPSPPRGLLRDSPLQI